MDLTSDYPFWSIQNGLLANYPSLDRDLSCDAVVVGGGITGSLVGYHLAEAGVKTILLEKRDIGTGSTSGSTALLQYEVDVPLRELIQKIGPAKANRSYELCHEAVIGLGHLIHKLKINCDFEKRPSLFLARQQSEISDLKEEHRLRRDLGIEVDFWKSSQLKKHFGFERPAALFSETAAQVDPHRLTNGLLAAGCKRGLHVFDRTIVKQFKPTRRGITLVTDRGIKITARRAIIAAGFESMPLVEGEAGSLKSTYAFISEPVAKFSDWHRRSLIWESGQPYLYLRTTSDNRIIIGGEDEEIVNPKRRDALIGKKTNILLRKFNKLFPDTLLEIAYSWAGTFGTTKDGLAYIGPNRALPHAYFALGYGGNGITYSLIAAQILRDAVLGKRNPDAQLFAFER